jgi:hypothetical protein
MFSDGMVAVATDPGVTPAWPGPDDERPDARLDGRLLSAVSDLHVVLRSTPTLLPVDGRDRLGQERREVVEQLDDYVLSRLAAMERPPLVVVGGPSGVGKSTLVNSLLGEAVTQPGLLRPTTRSPVLVHHPAERSWFAAEGVLPGLARVDGPCDDPGTLRMVPSSSLPPGIAIVDAPDFDSVDDQNRTLAAKLLTAADVWLFVTSAARYSDQLPWRHLELALEREATVVVVMNRIPAEDLSRVSEHLRRMLDERGFPRELSFFVENGPVDDDGILPADHVADLKQFVESLCRDTGAASSMVQQTVVGSVRRAVALAPRVADAAAHQAVAVGTLVARADEAYDAALAELRQALGDPRILAGQFAAQWREFSGVPDARSLPETFGSVRRRLLGAGATAEPEVARLELALNMVLENLVVAGAERAARRVTDDVRASALGETLLDHADDDLTRPARSLRVHAPQAFAAWQRGVVDAVRQELVSSDLAEGLDATAVRGLAVAVGVHAVTTPGLLDARAATLDRQGLGGLVVTAAEALATAAEGLLRDERERYLRVAAQCGWAAEDDVRLRTAAAAVARLLDEPPRPVSSTDTGKGLLR